MNYALSRPTAARRSSLLGIVIGLHIAVLLAIFAAKAVVPRMAEIPLIVDLLPPAETRRPEPKAQPVAKSQPVAKPAPQPTPAPRLPTPQIEATSSTQPAPAAPVAAPSAPVDSKPAAPATPVEAPVTQARFDADYLRNPAPPYPPLAKRMGEEGKVVLRVSVNAQGTADSVDIKTSSGSARLDEAAQKTVRQWRFIPAKRGDSAVQSFVLVPIIFKLEQ